MSKRTIVSITSDLHKAEWIPRSSGLVLAFEEAAYGRGLVDAWKRAGLDVVMLHARVPTLRDAIVPSFAGQGTHTVVVPDATPSIREALEAAPSLRCDEITVELPLTDDASLNVIKVLSSLRIKVRVPVEVLATGADVVLELAEDALLKPGTRAAVSPFQQLYDQRLDEDFEISQLDIRANDHFVDLRQARERPPDGAWDDVIVPTKRIPFLMDRSPCSTCEGLMFCHGYLGERDACRDFFSSFTELVDLVSARPQAAKRDQRGSSRALGERPPPQESKW